MFRRGCFRTMRCPACTKTLEKKFFRSIELYRCGTCGGFWVRKNMLGDVLNRYMAMMEKRADTKRGFRTRVNPAITETSKRSCPNCRGAMRKQNYAYNSNVIVDICDDCAGIWLESGEIEKIARHFKECGVGENMEKEFEDIDIIYDDFEREEALSLLREAIVWILSFAL